MSTPGVLEVVVKNIFLVIVVVISCSNLSYSFFLFFPSVENFETGFTTVAARLSDKNIGSNYFLYFFSV